MKELNVELLAKIIKEEGYNISVVPVNKNGTMLDAIVIAGSAVSPCYYIKSLNERMNALNQTEKEIAAFIIETYREIDFNHLESLSDIMLDFDNVKNHLVTGLMKAGTDNTISTMPFMGMDCYVYADFEHYRVNISKDIIKFWNVDKDYVFKIAEENSAKNILIFESDDSESYMPIMFFITISSTGHGASSACISAIEKIADKYKKDVWMIPIDVDKIVALLYAGETDEEVNAMIKYMRWVAPEIDELLDYGYLYIRENKTFRSTAPE